MNNLISQVEQWSKDKELHKANPDRQALKVWEEADFDEYVEAKKEDE